MTYQPKTTLRNLVAALLVLAAITACTTPLPMVTPSPSATSEPTATLEPTITVCASGCDFATIQTAIDDPDTNTGDIIGIADAIHTEEGITVDKSVTIQGRGADNTTVQAHAMADSATDRVFLIAPETTVTIRGITIRHGNPTDEAREGGGIASQGILTLEYCIVTDNNATTGGGIHNTGTLTLINSTVSDNTASGSSDPRRACATGGGIKNLEGALALINSTVSGNISQGKGGGIMVACKGTLELINSTVSGNDATGGDGGGLWIRGAAVFAHSTISNNNASGVGGGVYIKGTGESGLKRGWLDFTNTIIANNTDGREYCCDDCMLGDDSTIGINTNNLVEDNSCTPDYSGDPRLGPLADNGGDTETHALLPGSSAIDAIPVEGCAFATDQRGEPRAVDLTSANTSCDIGAFELQTDEG